MGRHKDPDTLGFINLLKKKGESLGFITNTEYLMFSGQYEADIVWKLEEDQEPLVTFEVDTRDTARVFSNASKYFGTSSNDVKKPWRHFIIVYKSKLSKGHKASLFNILHQHNIRLYENIFYNPSEQERLKKELETLSFTSLSCLKRKMRIMELEQMPLPMVVLEKMVGKEKAHNFHNYFEDGRTLEELPPELQEVEIKTVSPEEFSVKYQFSGWKILERDTKMVWEGEGESYGVGHEVGSITVGIYKELLRLYKEQFEYQWLKWKREYDLDDEEWGKIGKKIYEMMEMDCIPLEIEDFLVSYILSKSPKDQKRLRSLQSRQ